MFQELLAKLASKRGAMPNTVRGKGTLTAPGLQHAPGQQKPKMKSALRSLAIKRKVSGKGFKGNAALPVDNANNSY